MSAEESARAKTYQELVLRYEALGASIHQLLQAHGGRTDKLPSEALKRYRQLAEERDTLFSELQALEQEWLSEDGHVS
jgi:hypothetical protein